MPAVKNFRQNLRSAMQAKNISQRNLASASQMSYPHVNRILQGHAGPGLRQCDLLAKAVGISLEVLLLPPKEFSKWLLTRVSF